jgi:hypothetical protein
VTSVDRYNLVRFLWKKLFIFYWAVRSPRSKVSCSLSSVAADFSFARSVFVFDHFCSLAVVPDSCLPVKEILVRFDSCCWCRTAQPDPRRRILCVFLSVLGLVSAANGISLVGLSVRRPIRCLVPCAAVDLGAQLWLFTWDLTAATKASIFLTAQVRDYVFPSRSGPRLPLVAAEGFSRRAVFAGVFSLYSCSRSVRQMPARFVRPCSDKRCRFHVLRFSAGHVRRASLYAAWFFVRCLASRWPVVAALLTAVARSVRPSFRPQALCFDSFSTGHQSSYFLCCCDCVVSDLMKILAGEAGLTWVTG